MQLNLREQYKASYAIGAETAEEEAHRTERVTRNLSEKQEQPNS